MLYVIKRIKKETSACACYIKETFDCGKAHKSIGPLHRESIIKLRDQLTTLLRDAKGGN